VDISEQMAAEARRHLERQGVQDRVEYQVCDVNDGEALRRLGQFDLVYSTFSLHHWEDPVASMRNIWQTVAEGGSLYLLDLKRVWWMYYLPIGGGLFESIRAAYLPAEIAAMMEQAGIPDPRVNTRFPLAFMQSVVARR
jgi:2-polyprenyl-3-methyl-5-hydroxy-6-metoxy-1,4-benzoquinol methylase